MTAKTRIIKVSKGYVPQAWEIQQEKTWWRKEVGIWAGVYRVGEDGCLLVYSTKYQLEDCCVATEEEALTVLKDYEKYKEKQDSDRYDMLSLSSN
jgi:hypothetical protein